MPSIRAIIVSSLFAFVAACGPLPGEKPLVRSFETSYGGNWDQSIIDTNEAIRTAEHGSIVFLSLASRCEFNIWKGDYDAAMRDCNASIRAKPGHNGHPYANRARIFATQGNFDWAIEEFDIAIDLGARGAGPVANHPRVVGLGGKARIYSTSTDDSLRNADLAVQFAEKAVSRESDVRQPAYKVLHRDALAAAYAEAGRFADAVETQKATIKLVNESGWSNLTFAGRTLGEMLQSHLRDLEAGRPIRGGAY